MIDRFINSALDSASPAITKWRIIFCFVTMLFFSPNYYSLFQPMFYELSIQELSKTVVDVLLSTRSWVVALIVLFTLYIIPTVLYTTLRALSSLNIHLASPLINELIKLRKKSHHDLETLISTSFDTWKEKSKQAVSHIDNKKRYCELSSLSLVFYVTASLYHDVFNWIIALLLTLIYTVVIFFASRSILLLYLKDIAPYKVLEEYIKKK